MKALVLLCALVLLAQNVFASGDSVKSRSQLPTIEQDGCLEWNYKVPHCCQPPHCQFTVAWRKEGLRMHYHLTATVTSNTSVWVALGLSRNKLMGESDVVTCWVPPDSPPQLHHGWIEANSRDVDFDSWAVKLEKVQMLDKQLHCRFSREMTSPNSTLPDSSLTDPLHVLTASGPLIQEEGGQLSMGPHSNKAASHCQCNVTDCNTKCVCMDGLKYLLLKLHGVTMSMAFVFFMPTGALISRYYRIVFINSWFKGHVTVMVLGVACALSGLGLILGHTEGQFTVGYHQIVGVVCLVLCVIQPLIGLVRPAVGPTVRRRLFNVFHKTMALSILGLGVAALLLGVYIFHSALMIWMLAAIGLSIITNMGFMLLLEFLMRTQKFSSTVLPPVGYHKVTKFDELSESEEEVFVRDLPSKLSGKRPAQKAEPYRFEQALLLLFVIQSFSFAVLTAALIFFYDSFG